MIPGGDSVIPQQPMVWTTDGQRLCLLTTIAARTFIATWQRGAPRAVELRYQAPPHGPPGGTGVITGLAIASP